MKKAWNRGLIAAVAAVAVVVNPALAHVSSDNPVPDVAAPGNIVLPGLTPSTVLNHQAVLLSAHDLATPLSINISLPLRNQAALDDFIANQASHGVYMSQDQFDANFGPTPQQVQAVQAWATTHRLQTTYASADGILITLQGATADVESALNVRINDYRGQDGSLFYANAANPSVPASLGVMSVDGLNNIPRFHTLSHGALKAQLTAAATRGGGYFPSDFRTAYDLTGHGYDGTNQVIGLTLWGKALNNTDLTNFASASGDPAMTGTVVSTPTNTGADRIEWVYTNGTQTRTDAWVETAMDVEYAHGMAPHSHLVYYLGDETGTCPNCGGTDVGLENAMSLAANNAAIHVVSNSWGGGEAPSISDPFVSSTNGSLQHAAAVGTTFFFSSGDSGTDSGGAGAASYPADSPYVVSVGGTSLNTGSGFAYSSESVWGGGGAGCSTVFARTGTDYNYQAGLPASATNQSPSCSMRVEPDVSADADPNTGADVYYSNGHQQIGGTSLAAPLWTGMAAAANRYAAVNSLPALGWANPVIYSIAGNAAKYASDFHDVTSGSSTGGSFSYNAQPGFDQASGWGSIDWWNFVHDAIGGGGPTPTSTFTPVPPTATNTNTPTSTRTNTPVGPTATNTNTPVPATATNTSTPVPPTSTPTNTPTGGGGIANGGFESGSLAGWTAASSGTNAVAPQISAAQRHGGAYAALLGSGGVPEPNGDSCLYQNFSSGAGTLTAWYWPVTTDSVTYDWQEGAIRNAGTAGCGDSGGIFRVASNAQAWTQASTAVAAGAHQIYFNVHEDGYGDDTYMYLDDVSVPSGTGGATPTNTNTPVGPTATNTNTPVPATATNTSTPVPPTSTPTNTPTGGGGIANGGFESGSLAGWTAASSGTNAVAPQISAAQRHGGAYAALLGSGGVPEPNGDSCLYQNFSSGAGTLTAWYWPVTTDSVTYDWQEGAIRNAGTAGCGDSGGIFRVASNAQAWTQASTAVAAGAHQIYFNVHEDGYGDDTYMYLDDVSVH